MHTIWAMPQERSIKRSTMYQKAPFCKQKLAMEILFYSMCIQLYFYECFNNCYSDIIKVLYLKNGIVDTCNNKCTDEVKHHLNCSLFKSKLSYIHFFKALATCRLSLFSGAVCTSITLQHTPICLDEAPLLC